MSDGNRSGVAWMRLNVPPIERARARAKIVLPTPGTSWSSRWPPASNTVTTKSSAERLPTTTRSRFTTSASRPDLICSTSELAIEEGCVDPRDPSRGSSLSSMPMHPRLGGITAGCSSHNCANEICNLLDEPQVGKALGMAANSRAIPCDTIGVPHGGGHGRRRLLVKEDTGDPVHDALESAPASICDDGTSARLRLNGHHAKVLLAGKDQSLALPVVPSQHRIGDLPDDPDIPTRDSLGWSEELSVDRRMDHGSHTVVVLPDSISHKARVSDEVVDPLCGDPIPLPQPRECGPGPGPQDGWCRSQVLLWQVPRIAHRRVTITDVDRPWGDDHALRAGMAAAYDHVVAAEVQMRKGERHEGNQPAVASRRPWKALQPRAPHVKPTKRLRQPTQGVECDKHGGLWKHVMQ